MMKERTTKEIHMKNIFKTLLFTLLLSGCYEDKGNYDYTLDSMNDITSVKFTPAIVETAQGKVIEVRQALSEDDKNCRIEAHLEQTLEKNLENLDFYWYRTHKDGNGTITGTDTIYTRGFLEIELPIGEMVQQDILLKIYDNTTTLSHYSSFKFMTRQPFKNSLFVLHGEEGDRKLGNIAIIGDETEIYTDIKSITKDDNLYNNAKGLDYSCTDEGLLTITVFNENGTARGYEPFEMKHKFFSEELFKPDATGFSFKSVIKAGDPLTTQYKVVLSENGKIYVGNNLPALYRAGYGAELEEKPMHISDYYITAATITNDNYFFWDEKEDRFLNMGTKNIGGNFVRTEEASKSPDLLSNNVIVDANIDYSLLGEDTPVGKTAVLGYINYTEEWEVDYKDFYFIFKDDVNNYYRYELATGEKGSAEACTIKNVKKLVNFNPSDPKTIKYCTCFSTNYLFYANGSTIYRYNVANGDNVVVYEAPEGYQVTLMKLRTDDYNSANYYGDLVRTMSIGLYNENEMKGAIAEVKFTTAADVDKDYVQPFYDKDNEGNNFGRIIDLQFARESQYELADYQKGGTE